MTRRPLLLALAVTAVALSGCISLLPKSKPAQLYSFVPPPAAAPATPSPANAVAVFRTNGSFQEASADDPMLTITGRPAASIADSRCVAPASVLFCPAACQA